MKEIALTNNRGIVIVDDQDVPLVEGSTWYYSKRGLSTYAVRHVKISCTKYRQEYLHRLILNPPNGMEVDHINGNGLDNRRENLRTVTKRENACNRTHITKGSKFVGVTWRKKERKWRADIRFQGKKRHLGLFKNEIDAATAYRVAYAVLIKGE